MTRSLTQRILDDYVRPEPGEWTTGQIADDIGEPRSVVRAVVNELRQDALVRCNERKRLVPGASADARPRLVGPPRPTHEQTVLSQLSRGAQTAHMVACACALPVSTVGSVLVRLRRRGLIEAAGTVRAGAKGHCVATLWVRTLREAA